MEHTTHLGVVAACLLIVFGLEAALLASRYRSLQRFRKHHRAGG
jgi:hypothetical protein